MVAPETGQARTIEFLLLRLLTLHTALHSLFITINTAQASIVMRVERLTIIQMYLRLAIVQIRLQVV